MFVHCLRERVSTEKEQEQDLVAENISMRAELKTAQADPKYMQAQLEIAQVGLEIAQERLEAEREYRKFVEKIHHEHQLLLEKEKAVLVNERLKTKIQLMASKDEKRLLEHELDDMKEKVQTLARTVQLKKCQVQELKLQQIKITRDKATQTDLVLSSTPDDTVSANACTALILVPSNFSSEHPDFEKLVDDLSCNVGGCDEEPSASCLSLVACGQAGYVYAAWNPLFPDLIKIGATMRASPYLRVRELSSCAGVPEPFQLVASIPTPDPFALERTIHAFYASARKYGRRKEFFMLSRDNVVYHFHVRSLEAMGSCSGVSSGEERAKKRKAK